MKIIPIGQLLVEAGYITEQQLNEALIKQKSSEKQEKIGDVLLRLGMVSETQLVHALSTRLKVPYIDLVTAKIDIESVKKIPEDVAKKNTVIGFKENLKMQNKHDQRAPKRQKQRHKKHVTVNFQHVGTYSQKNQYANQQMQNQQNRKPHHALTP